MLLIIFQDLQNTQGTELSLTIAFLTAMITPALLISASGMLVLSTSTRLGRVIDRVRELDTRLKELIEVEDHTKVLLYERRIESVFHLLNQVTTRSRLLQSALEFLYTSLVFFVLTSVTIGMVGLLGVYQWLPVPFGILGILAVLIACLQMMREARMATHATNAEMDVTWEIAMKTAPESIVKRYTFNRFGKGQFRKEDDVDPS